MLYNYKIQEIEKILPLSIYYCLGTITCWAIYCKAPLRAASPFLLRVYVCECRVGRESRYIRPPHLPTCTSRNLRASFHKPTFHLPLSQASHFPCSDTQVARMTLTPNDWGPRVGHTWQMQAMPICSSSPRTFLSTPSSMWPSSTTLSTLCLL